MHDDSTIPKARTDQLASSAPHCRSRGHHVPRLCRRPHPHWLKLCQNAQSDCKMHSVIAIMLGSLHTCVTGPRSERLEGGFQSFSSLCAGAFHCLEGQQGLRYRVGTATHESHFSVQQLPANLHGVPVLWRSSLPARRCSRSSDQSTLYKARIIK